MTVNSRRGFNGLLSVVCALTLCMSAAAPAFAVSFAVTSPWLGMIAKFIAGSNGNVRSSATRGDIIIAIDREDAARARVPKNSSRLRVLYEKVPMSEAQLRRAFFDPAMLPFIAQDVMKIMANADKSQYSYYQRRLAEFQSHIDSTTDVGRYMVGKTKILDLTGAEGAWVRSAVASSIRPTQHQWNTWLQGDTSQLAAMLADAAKNGRIILLDTWTPSVIRAAALSYDNRVTLPTPSIGKDYFQYLHDIFITIRDKAAKMNAAASPQKKKKR